MRVNWAHPLNRGLAVWLLALPSPRGGAVWQNLTGRGGDGTLTNMDPATDWVGPMLGHRDGGSVSYNHRAGGWGALAFDGSDDHVLLGNVPALDGWTSTTVACWVNAGAGGSMVQFARLIEKGTNQDWVILFNPSPGTGNLQVAVGNTTVLDASLSFGGNGWHHIVMTTRPNTYAALYVDGAFDVSTTFTGALTNTGAVTIGKFGGAASHYYAGLLDDVRIYRDRVLNAAEARALYTLSRHGYPGLVLSPPGRRLAERTAGGGGGLRPPRELLTLHPLRGR